MNRAATPPSTAKARAAFSASTPGIGDDHFRYSGTNFVPSVQNKKGLTFDKVDPRFTFSGPIRKGKMWFYDSSDGEYDNIVITELPNGADNDRLWRFGNLAKVQTNFTARDILTASFNINHLHDDHAGLSIMNPVEATLSDIESAYLASVKNQHYFQGGELLETGAAFLQYDLRLTPAGTLPYFVTPETAGQNYYLFADTRARRWQGLANLYITAQEMVRPARSQDGHRHRPPRLPRRLSAHADLVPCRSSAAALFRRLFGTYDLLPVLRFLRRRLFRHRQPGNQRLHPGSAG